MKYEIIELHDVQIIGMAKKGGTRDVDNIVGGHLAFNEAKEECPKFWGESVEKIIKPVVLAKITPLLTSSAVYIKVATCRKGCSSSPFIAADGCNLFHPSFQLL